MDFNLIQWIIKYYMFNLQFKKTTIHFLENNTSFLTVESVI